MAGGEDGVDRRFSILGCGFLIVPSVQVIEVLRAKKQRYRGCFECDKKEFSALPIQIQYIV